MSVISNWVLGSGPSNAKLMIIGEAPGKNEEIQRKCFVGQSGELLTEILENANISRQSCYLTNVVKVRPPNNDLEMLCEVINEDTSGYYKIEDFLPLLFNEIEAIHPNLILAVGSLACKILTGKDGIKNWRGSILPLQNFHPDHSFQFTNSIKVIPTIHPAALFERNYKKDSGEGMFTWKQKAHIQFDVFKAAREMEFADFSSIPTRNIEIVRSSIQLERFFNMYKDMNKVYVDTEVYKSHLVCIGFAFTRYHACSIPLIDLQDNENFKGIPLHELCEIWRVVGEKLANVNLGKAGQNFKADKLYWLEKAGFEVNGFCDDGMFKIHTLSPELPKSLAFQQSIYTNQPFHKHEGKEYNPKKDNINVLLKYNGMDCVVNCECLEEMDKDILELGLQDFHKGFVMDLYPIYEDIEKRGWLVNKEKKIELHNFYTKELEAKIQKEIELLTALNIVDASDEFGEKGPYNFDSPKQVHELVYIKMKCPLRKDTSDETLTALMNNVVKDKRKKEVIEIKLDERSLSKIRHNYVDYQEDLDGRMRCGYNQVGTETGRTSTSIIKKPLRNGQWGFPIQTSPRPDEYGGKVREQFTADPGYVLMEFDQSQAELRLAALLANDLELLEFLDIPEVNGVNCDAHKLTASFVFNYTQRTGTELINTALVYKKLHSMECFCSECKELRKNHDFDFSFLNLVAAEEREQGKRARHGFTYDLGEEGLAIRLRISIYRAKMAYKKIDELSPKIKGVYHEEIQKALADNNKVFFTPFGRRREFFEKWGKELFREAYAHLPQSTIGDNTKRAMRNLVYKEKVIFNTDVNKGGYAQLLAEIHDAFIAQVPENKVREFYQIAKFIFEEKIDFDKCTIKRNPLVIPVDAKIGYNWGEMKKYKGE